MTLKRHAATAALFTCLAVLHTWPIARMPATWSNSNGDYALNAWALAWVVHQAPRDPLHLFDANIFYPEPRTLAFSEHLVPQAMFAAPVLWSGGSAVLAYNLVLLVGFVLTGWSMAWAVTRWTGELAGRARRRIAPRLQRARDDADRPRAGAARLLAAAGARRASTSCSRASGGGTPARPAPPRPSRG